MIDPARTPIIVYERTVYPGGTEDICGPLDPYYLSFRAQQLGKEPEVTLAGRSINDSMGGWIADQLNSRRGAAGSALVMGLAFKGNVRDLRNSRVVNLIDRRRCSAMRSPCTIRSSMPPKRIANIGWKSALTRSPAARSRRGRGAACGIYRARRDPARKPHQ